MPMTLQEIQALAVKVNSGVDRIFAVLPDWKHDQIIVLLIGCVRAIAEERPEHRDLAIAQLTLALNHITNPAAGGD